MKLPLLAGLLICGCLASFRSQATSYEYDWVGDSPSPLYSGSIFLDAPTNPSPEGTISDIVSYNITANGINFNSSNSGIGSLGPFFEWDSSTISTIDLTITNSTDTVILSITAGGMNGTGIPMASGEWDAPPSVPDATNTLPLFVIALISLGWYYNRIKTAPQRAVAIKRQEPRVIRRSPARFPYQNRL